MILRMIFDIFILKTTGPNVNKKADLESYGMEKSCQD
jgi:hypothetical protein